MILTRILTPHEYGLITLVIITLPGLLQFFTNSFLYDTLSHSKEGKKYFSFSFVYGIIASFAVIVLIFISRESFFDFLNIPSNSWFLILVALFIVILPNTLLGVIIGLYRGLRRYSLASTLSLAPPVLRLFFILVVVYILSISKFWIILIVAALPTSIVLISVLMKGFKLMSSMFDSISFPSKNIFSFGFSVYLISTFGTVTQQIYKVIVSHDLGVVWQGYFDVSLTLMTILLFAFAALSFVSIPEATSTENMEELLFKQGELGDIARGLFSFLVFCMIFLYFYSSRIISLLFTHEYVVVADYILFLAIGYIFLFIQQFLAYLNISFQNPSEYRPLVIVTLIFLVVSPLVTHIFIYFAGFVGAYLALMMFSILYTIATIKYSKNLTPLRVLFYKIDGLILASVVIILFLHFFGNFLMSLFLSTIIFSFLVFFTGYINKRLIFGIFKEKN
ncbi:MAG: lipopolysaccharide biosynthesis protein [Archaeoglobus sp.]|nr:lipopolysaccharide biosynthesis protein [Archaeoglobus sp.]